MAIDDKQPNQADGRDGRKGAPDGVGDTATHGKSGSESQGGAYPTERRRADYDGGQSGKAYHGTGQLGSEETGDNENAPAKGD